MFSGCGRASRWRHVLTSWCTYLRKRRRIHSQVAAAAAAKKPRAQRLRRRSRDPIGGNGWERTWRSWPMRASVTHHWWRIVVLATAVHARPCPRHSLITPPQSYLPLSAVSYVLLALYHSSYSSACQALSTSQFDNTTTELSPTVGSKLCIISSSSF